MGKKGSIFVFKSCLHSVLRLELFPTFSKSKHCSTSSRAYLRDILDRCHVTSLSDADPQPPSVPPSRSGAAAALSSERFESGHLSWLEPELVLPWLSDSWSLPCGLPAPTLSPAAHLTRSNHVLSEDTSHHLPSVASRCAWTKFPACKASQCLLPRGVSAAAPSVIFHSAQRALLPSYGSWLVFLRVSAPRAVLTHVALPARSSRGAAK